MNVQCLYKIGYGLYIVSSKKGDKLNGQIANTVFQITSDPPTLAVSINKNNLTHEYIEDSGLFTVSVLRQDTPLPFIGNFGFKSGRDADKFEGIKYKLTDDGVPYVAENTVAFMEAKVISKTDVGTHTVYIGELIDGDVLSDEPAMTYEYYHQVKRGTTPKSAPSYIKKEGEK